MSKSDEIFSWDKIKRDPLFIILIIFSCGVLIYEAYKVSIIKRDGVYVLGQKVRVIDGGSRSSISEFNYTYKKNSYKYKYVDGGFSNSIVFLKINPSKPKACILVEDTSVPSCLITLVSADTSWERLPLNVCKD